MATNNSLGGVALQFTAVKFNNKKAVAKLIGDAIVAQTLPGFKKNADRLRQYYINASGGKDHAPGKNDWKKATADRFEVVLENENGLPFIGLKFKDDMSPAERVQTMLVEYGSGNKSSLGGSAIYFGPAGRMVWNDALTGQQESRYGWPEHQYYRKSTSWGRYYANHSGFSAEALRQDRDSEYIKKKVYIKEIHVKDDGTKVETYKRDKNGKKVFREYTVRKVHKRSLNPKGFRAPDGFNQVGLGLIKKWTAQFTTIKQDLKNITTKLEGGEKARISKVIQASYQNIVT